MAAAHRALKGRGYVLTGAAERLKGPGLGLQGGGGVGRERKELQCAHRVESGGCRVWTLLRNAGLRVWGWEPVSLVHVVPAERDLWLKRSWAMWVGEGWDRAFGPSGTLSNLFFYFFVFLPFFFFFFFFFCF